MKNVGLEWSTSATTHITRHFGSLPYPLPTAAEVQTALAAPQYDVAPYTDRADHTKSFRNALEGWRNNPIPIMFCGPDGVLIGVPLGDTVLHNVVHAWVGGLIGLTPDGVDLLGTMTVPLASPNDPVFFLHHANIDRIRAQWQEAHGVDTYVPTSGYPDNNVDDEMLPFTEAGISATPALVADASALGYSYDDVDISPAARAQSTEPLPALDQIIADLPLPPLLGPASLYCSLVPGASTRILR